MKSQMLKEKQKLESSQKSLGFLNIQGTLKLGKQQYCQL